jgi:hypothetical protein
MEMNLEEKYNGNSEVTNNTVTDTNEPVRTRKNKTRKNVRNLEKRSFQSSKTLKRRLGSPVFRNTRQLADRAKKLEKSLRKYDDLEGEAADLYSYLFSLLGETMAEDINEYFFDKKSTSLSGSFRNKVRKYVTEAGLKEFEIATFDDYIRELAEFMKWLAELASSHDDIREDIDTYAKHLLALFRTIFIENKKEFLRKVETMDEEESGEIDDLMKAFGKTRI